VRFWKRAFGGDARAPRDVNTAMRRSLLAILDHDLDQAELLLTAVVRRNSRAVDAYLALARLYRQRGEIGRGIRIHQNLLLRTDLSEEQHFQALLGLAEDFRQGGFLRRAIAAYEEALTQRPKHRDVLTALVRLFVDIREPRRALALERRLARLEGRDSHPAEANLWVDLAEAARSEGRTDEARRALRRALRRDPESVRAWLELGELEAERRHTRKALAAWRRIPEIDRRRGQLVYPRLAASFAAIGRPRDHEKMLRRLLEERPDDADARLALARALAERGETEEGMNEVRRVLERDPDHLEARSALGRILLAADRVPEALKAYAELLDILERRAPAPTEEALE
jgi:lipopolysaccharide biosynthesis regulator YciM